MQMVGGFDFLCWHFYFSVMLWWLVVFQQCLFSSRMLPSSSLCSSLFNLVHFQLVGLPSSSRRPFLDWVL
jgi:hypothetical protein